MSETSDVEVVRIYPLVVGKSLDDSKVAHPTPIDLPVDKRNYNPRIGLLEADIIFGIERMWDTYSELEIQTFIEVARDSSIYLWWFINDLADGEIWRYSYLCKSPQIPEFISNFQAVATTLTLLGNSNVE